MGTTQVYIADADGSRVGHACFGLPCIDNVRERPSYQVRFGLLDAARYGVPQPRRRMIYMAARQGLKLPILPLPTHHSNAPVQRPLKASWGYVPASPPDHSIPHMQITIRDSIGDLPRFDW
jgi:DNA (cytosine-5)-methyltransferase 1